MSNETQARFTVTANDRNWDKATGFTVWDNEHIGRMGVFKTRCAAEAHVRKCERANSTTDA